MTSMWANVPSCIIRPLKGKLAVSTSGPFEIVHVHVNGTITIQLQPGVMEQINIFWIIPFKDPLV